MFTLVTEKAVFYRVKRGQNGKDIEKTFSVPCGKVFSGAIIAVNGGYEIYSVKPCETYRSLSGKFGIGEEELKAVNFSRPLYPTQKLFIPRG